MAKQVKFLCRLCCLISALAGFAAGQQTPAAGSGPCRSPAVEAVADNLAATFDQHQFVFIGSTHGDAKIEDFLRCLVSRRSFNTRATDIVVEYASPFHQGLMDRYLLTVDPIAADTLAAAWFDTDNPRLWAGLPQIPAFFAAVRAVNVTLPPAKRLRIIGGNEPVNWATVQKPEDLAPYPYKNNNTAHLITEHLAHDKSRRVLVVYGDGHIHRNGGTLMAELEAKIDRTQLFVIGTIDDLKTGERDAVSKFGDPAGPFWVTATGFPQKGPYPSDLFYVRSGPVASYVDAIIYLGPEPNRSLLDTVPLSAAQRTEIDRREALLGDPRRVMQIRYGGKDTWFRTHPLDLPQRP